MENAIKEKILQATDSIEIIKTELIQNLWNNYGELVRVFLKKTNTNSKLETVILKHIKIPGEDFHPKGHSTKLSKQRKIDSYKVETNWYECHNDQCLIDDDSLTPQKIASFQNNNQFFLLLEDLDAQGFGHRLTVANLVQAKVVLSWLAHFHARFLESEPTNIFDVGTYWHLETRPDELKILAKEDLALKQVASLIDQKLKNSRFQSFVHGDAKLANFCFSQDYSKVAAVDFQYVGRGCPMKDLIYFVGSCFNEDECEKYRSEVLDNYFHYFRAASDSKLNSKEIIEIEKEWRSLYNVAWADFHRFIKGWSPDHWKINSYSEKLSQTVVREIYGELLGEAKLACREAGKIVRQYWQKKFKISRKESGTTKASAIVTEVDIKSQEKIISLLAPSMRKYNLGILAEEDPANTTRFEKDYFWCVDPLDGTLFFSEGKPGIAISIALVDREGVPLIGVVYDPLKEIFYTAIEQQGAFKDEKPLKVISPPEKMQSRPHLFADLSLKNHPLYKDLQKKYTLHFTGGAVMNAINVILQEEDAYYFKFPKKERGGCASWDLAATYLILKEAGGFMRSFHGEKLTFNKKENLYYNEEGLFVCKKENHHNINIQLLSSCESVLNCDGRKDDDHSTPPK